MFLLQNIPAVEVSADSLEAKKAMLAEKIMNTPPKDLLADLGEQAIQFGLKVLAALLIYIIGAWLIRVIRRAVRRGFERRKAEPTLASFVDSLVSISLWVVLIIITISTLGINTTSLAALLAAGGMAIGMALSGTVQNFAGGIMLLIFKPFKVGDYIEAQGFAGTVTEVNMVSTKLLTVDNRVIILPNGTLSNGNINNFSGKKLRRVDIPLSVAYGSDAQKVKEAVLEIISLDPLFLDGKVPGAADPVVALTDLGASSVNFTVRAWVKASDYWAARFALNENIYTLLPSRYGIQFPFPQMDVHIKQD
ncbi:MAG: mechanosensitive ion channel [Bacteroidales bacterium]|nr:mechanosensitive ion channel [Bacteroidales bacterium]